MMTQDTKDRLLEQQRRDAWRAYAAASLTGQITKNGNSSDVGRMRNRELAAIDADAMLEEEMKRYPEVF